MDTKLLTVFTPTYNRAYLLPQLYQSLLQQTCKDFIWLVIDDGSTDPTRELVQEWIKGGKVAIKYVYKENGGMHTGHNKAYEIIDTELNVCIDSDDYMPDDAVEKILNCWKNVKNEKNLAGIIGLDADKYGNIIGSSIPRHLIKGNLHDLYNKYNVKGDKKIVLRTEIVRKYQPYPEYQDEKLVPLGVLYLMIGQSYDFIYKNDVYCIVEYQEQGSSNTIMNQYIKSPKGFAYARRMQIVLSNEWLIKFKGYVHLVSSAIFAKDFKLAFKEVNPIFTTISIPFGIILNLYIRLKTKKWHL